MSEIIDNRANRIKTMKSIITRLHAGENPQTVMSDMATLVKETDASEIAAMEQELINDGVSAEKIKSMCDLHADVLKDITVNPEEEKVKPGHPVDTIRLENFALQNEVDKLRKLIADLSDLPAEDDAQERRFEMLSVSNKLMDIDKHYSRKENILFPYLEKYGITGPSEVMWAKDDEVRDFLKTLGKTLQDNHSTVADLQNALEDVAEPALTAIEGMIYKEENILLPMSMQTLTVDEWGEIFTQSPEIGWCIDTGHPGSEPFDGMGVAVFRCRGYDDATTGFQPGK